MKKERRLAFLLSGVLCLTSCRALPENRLPEAAAREPSPEAPDVVAATGIVSGVREADVGARIPGRVLRFEYDEGDRMEAGAAVVLLEDRDLRAHLEKAKAAAWDACASFERLRVLSEEDVASRSELEHAQALCARMKADAKRAAVILEHATIRAPFGGTLIRKFKEVGETVSADTVSDPVFHLADLSALKVTAEVPEADIERVRIGQSAQIRADAYLGPSFPATVSKIALAAGRKKLRSDDPRERLDEKIVEVELELPRNEALRSGMTVDVVIETEGSPPSHPAASSPASSRS